MGSFYPQSTACLVDRHQTLSAVEFLHGGLTLSFDKLCKQNARRSLLACPYTQLFSMLDWRSRFPSPTAAHREIRAISLRDVPPLGFDGGSPANAARLAANCLFRFRRTACFRCGGRSSPLFLANAAGCPEISARSELAEGIRIRVESSAGLCCYLFRLRGRAGRGIGVAAYQPILFRCGIAHGRGHTRN